MQITSSEIVKGILSLRMKKNPSYSLRAAARDLKVSHGFLSQFLNGKKKLSFEKALVVCQALGLGQDTTDRLLRAVVLESTKGTHCREFLESVFSNAQDKSDEKDAYAVLELDRFRFLSDWYHIAILDMTLLKGFKSDVHWIAKKLDIPVEQADQAVKRLIRLGLVEVQGKKWVKTSAKLAIPTHAPDKAIQNFHHQMIDKAKEALSHPDPEEFHNREISGITLTVSPERLPEAKKKVQAFKREMLAFLGKGEPSELYQMNIQLFRLTKEPFNKGEKP